ncbi:MAG: hypothetical protein HC941_09225 [Microcoleus sp. SU_5_3]|nr:hypothetical protein [Microcoleus sp. SU_5_3]
MGVSSKSSESNDYESIKVLPDELGKTFVYDRVQDNIDETSVLNKTPIPARPKKASNSWVWWVIFLLLSVTITSRTSLKNNYGKQPIDPPPVRLPRYTP